VDAHQARARTLFELDRADEGQRELDECVARTPGADCAADAVTGLRWQGRLDDALAAARAWLTATAGSEPAYREFAYVLAATGATDAAVVEAIRQFAARAPPAMSSFLEGQFLVKLDVLRGRFGAAERRTRDLASQIERVPDAYPHYVIAALEAGLLRERGDRERTAAVAAEFAARQIVWSRGDLVDRATPMILDALDETGAAPHADVLRRMAAWRDLEVVRARRPDGVRALAGLVARTADDARPAAAIHTSQLIWAFADAFVHIAVVGRARHLTGDVAGAIAALERAAKLGGGLGDPFTDTRARLWLGAAYEAKSDVPAACAAYAEVLRRWGAEKPLVKTAEAATARRAALHCP
jgi:hypothetical protein